MAKRRRTPEADKTSEQQTAPVLWRCGPEGLSCPTFGSELLKWKDEDDDSDSLLPKFLDALEASRGPNWRSEEAAVGKWCLCAKLADFGCTRCLGNFFLRVPAVMVHIPEVLLDSPHGPYLQLAKQGDDGEALAGLVQAGLKPVASHCMEAEKSAEFAAVMRQRGLATLVKEHPEGSWEVFIAQPETMKQPVASLFGESADAAARLSALFDEAEKLAVAQHGEDGRGRLWAVVLPHQPIAGTLGAAVLEAARRHTVEQCLRTYDISEYTVSDVYSDWESRRMEKYQDFLVRMTEEEQWTDGFKLCGPWMTGALYGYPFWTSFSMCLVSDPYESDPPSEPDDEDSEDDQLE
eukprot:TRINITY_DN19303_c0_g2_i2.p1 TRINITY_DN19303_c0_g2~~TRINITY_DN19303_c0_g2_i2.p1  ORF type:complete len:350 (-),score=75.14 TRINITY_DN19303_c0_g2_i2:711-1760(-)